MNNRKSSTKNLQPPLPPRVERKYIRRLLEAFEPYQDAMLAELDQQIEENDPEAISNKSFELSDQWLNKIKQLDQIERTEGAESDAIINLKKEIEALGEASNKLREQIIPSIRRRSCLRQKRKSLVGLLQDLYPIRQE